MKEPTLLVTAQSIKGVPFVQTEPTFTWITAKAFCLTDESETQLIK